MNQAPILYTMEVLNELTEKNKTTVANILKNGSETPRNNQSEEPENRLLSTIQTIDCNNCSYVVPVIEGILPNFDVKY